jgi:hypothetical protein
MVKLATLALGVAFATITSDSFAQSNHANRAQAIQDCNAAAGKYSVDRASLTRWPAGNTEPASLSWIRLPTLLIFGGTLDLPVRPPHR